MQPTTMPTEPKQPLPGGTRVLNTNDAESGHILNGFTFEPDLGWTEYEVTTQDGIERWHRRDFVLFTEIEHEQV